jgi:hypothetical protein
MDELMQDTGIGHEFSANSQDTLPRYDLTQEEMQELETNLVKDVESLMPDAEICALWIDPRSPYANFIRMHEASYFPEVTGVTPEDELNTAFLAIVDMRDSARRVVHGATVMGERFRQSGTELDENRTGFFTVDSLIELGNFSAQEFRDYYKANGIDLSKSISVETNFRIGDKAEPYNGVGTADLTYVALFRSIMEQQPDFKGAVVFATVNKMQRSSFQRVGMRADPLMGVEQYRTPEAELGIESQPVSILYDEQVVAILDNDSIVLPQLPIR